jgi:uncharacterized Zn finger protein
MARFLERFKPYVRVADRQAMGERAVLRKLKKGEAAHPVPRMPGSGKIAKSFWGAAWCENLESYSDYENRLPRGRTYVRNGSVMHLAITAGEVRAFVQGSELYTVEVSIAKLARPRWSKVVAACAGKIDSLVELLQGRISSAVMQVVTDHERGMFPAPREIELSCSCPDWATMCKHVAAVLYGVGARLDEQPELLFVLRGVDHLELLGASTEARPTGTKQLGKKTIAEVDLADVFGIEIDAWKPKVRRS